MTKTNEALEHLRLLSVLHYVMGGLGLVLGLFPLSYIFMGIMLLRSHGAGAYAQQPPSMGYMMIAMGVMWLVLAEGCAVCTLISGRCLAKRRRRIFSIVVGAVNCAFFPIGTLLGVFTIIALSRESVQALYEGAEPAPEPLAAQGAPATATLMTENTNTPPPVNVAPASDEKGDATGGIIPYKNPHALAAYYLGIFSLIPVIGFFLACAALPLGISGLRKRKAKPIIRGSVHAWIGIVLGGLVLLVYLFLLTMFIIGIASHRR